MSIWRNTSKEERTQLYLAISKAVRKNSSKLSAVEKNLLIDAIFNANKEYYDIHITQMSEFISSKS